MPSTAPTHSILILLKLLPDKVPQRKGGIETAPVACARRFRLPAAECYFRTTWPARAELAVLGSGRGGDHLRRRRQHPIQRYQGRVCRGRLWRHRRPVFPRTQLSALDRRGELRLYLRRLSDRFCRHGQQHPKSVRCEWRIRRCRRGRRGRPWRGRKAISAARMADDNCMRKSP
jgi:hypothetical protein